MVSAESEKERVLREEVRAWLDENLPDKWGTPDYEAPEEDTTEARDLNRSFTKKSYDAGYTGFGVPVEYGGVERPAWERAIIREELGRRGTPPMAGGLGRLVVETLMQWGTEEQKKRYIPGIISGQVHWIEGFSEPNAGSDLANVQTTGVRDGDEWVVNGQKCWTSGWRFGDWCFLLCRTDLNAPRHRNLSYFLFDCNTPGFSRGPLRQMTGDSLFGELFFDDMRIPHENMVGEEGRGWYVAMTTLIAERGGGRVDAASGESGVRGTAVRTIGGSSARFGTINLLIEMAKNNKHYGRSAWDNGSFRHRIAQLAIEGEAMRAYGVRLASIIRSGKASGNEAVMQKMMRTEKDKRHADLMMEIFGAYSQLVEGDPRAIEDGRYSINMLRTRGSTISAGSSEICRNILSERILGLPRE